jgi:hypothetical protein
MLVIQSKRFMKTILICALLAVAIVRGVCGTGDDMLITKWTTGQIAWTNCILGTTCSVQVATTTVGGSWTDLVSSLVVTSALTRVDVPAISADTAFLRVARPFDPLLGLVAWYQFEGNTLDSSAWHNDGTNKGVVFVSGPSGLCGSFDGASTYIRVPQNSTLKLANAMTICAWIKPLATDGLRCIVDKDYDLVGYNLYVNGGGLHMRICGSSITTGTITNGGWQHVAGVFTGNKIRIFVNGLQQGETDSGGLTDRADKDVYIGMWGPPGGPSRYFYGWMDEVRIYARPLTPSEIRCLAQSGP